MKKKCLQIQILVTINKIPANAIHFSLQTHFKTGIINVMQVTSTHIKDSDVETDVVLGNGLRFFKWSI